MKHITLLAAVAALFLSAQVALAQAPAAPASPTEVDFDRQGVATPQGRGDSDSVLTDLFSEERAGGTATPAQGQPGQAAPRAVPGQAAPSGLTPLAPPPVAQPATPTESNLTPPGIPSPVARPAGPGEAVIERSGGGVVTAPAATPSAQATPAAQPSQATPKRRRAARPREPKFANSDEANWYYASKAWITPNQADKLGCQSSYAATYTLYHLRCINQVKGF